jgi:hypothetical protein
VIFQLEPLEDRMAFPRSFGQLIDKYIDKLCRTNNKNIGNKKWRDNRQELGRWWENHRFAISFPIKIKKTPRKKLARLG